eukprot:scaffold18434_cov67-Isochrysis_galbana.AAC.1
MPSSATFSGSPSTISVSMLGPTGVWGRIMAMMKTGSVKAREPMNCLRHERVSWERAEAEKGSAAKGDTSEERMSALKPRDRMAEASARGV